MLSLAPKDLALGCSISLIWGLNFVVIKLALDDVAPMTLMGFRFRIVAFALNRQWKAFFGDHGPCRLCIGTDLQAGMLMEVSFVAELN